MTVQPELKIIADHLRSSCFLIADGVSPSNEGRGYVLRRIMRRGMRQLHKLGAKEAAMYKLVDALIKEMGSVYPELSRARAVIVETLKNEEEKFRETLANGLKILEEEILRIEQGEEKYQEERWKEKEIIFKEIENDLEEKYIHAKKQGTLMEKIMAGIVEPPLIEALSGAIAFKLYDTYGFPLDLTQDILKEKNIEVDVKGFNREMELQRERARKNWVGSGEEKGDSFFFELKEKLGETKFVGYEDTRSKAKILAIVEGKNLSPSIATYSEGCFILLDQTPFYATSGGQKGDDGNIVLASEIQDFQPIDYSKLSNFIDIFETKKLAGNLFAHFVSDLKGEFKIGDEVIAIVNSRNRQFRAQNHSSTHLLHKALKEILGNSISQKGSNVDANQLTFDFNFNRAMSSEEIEKVEDLVNFYIRKNSEVKTDLMSLEKARETGAEALFGEKYESDVRVVRMDPSVELCGGTHVKQTGNIGIFKIISENGIAAGIRRITSKSGFYALQHMKVEEKKLQALLDSLKIKQQFNEVKFSENEFLSPKKGFDDTAYFTSEVTGEITSKSEGESLQEVLKQVAKIGEDLQQELKKKDKEIERLKKQIIFGNLGDLKAEKIDLLRIKTSNEEHDEGEVRLLTHTFDDIDAKELREIVIDIKARKEFEQRHIFAFFATKDGKLSVIVALSNDLVKDSDLDSSKLIVPVIETIGGKGGGGKKELAMGGGVNKQAIPQAITTLKIFCMQ